MIKSAVVETRLGSLQKHILNLVMKCDNLKVELQRRVLNFFSSAGMITLLCIEFNLLRAELHFKTLQIKISKIPKKNGLINGQEEKTVWFL